MILSMTGFGRASVSSSGKKITVDVKSLNSKQLDLQTRMPGIFREAELDARSLVAEALKRGKIELTVGYESIGEDTPMRLNRNVIESYKKQIEDLSITLDIPEPADWYATLLRLPDTLKSTNEDLSESDRAILLEAVHNALEALIEFRATEGKKLYDFFASKIKNIRILLESVEPYENERVPKIKNRLREQLSRLDSIEFEPGRLEQEMIFYIEKLDVTEEKTRLHAHLNYFMETMDLPEANQGKKLGFIAQEIGREINTLGSKSNHAEMQKIVVKMKDELEQIKEQVLNVL